MIPIAIKTPAAERGVTYFSPVVAILLHTVFWAGDYYSIAFVVGKVAPQPADHDEKLIPESNNRNKMNEHPDEPGNQALGFKRLQIYNCLISPNCGHAALIFVPERY